MKKPPFASRLLERLDRLRSQAAVMLARASGVSVAEGVRLGPGADLRLGWDLSRRGVLALDRGTHLSDGVVLHPYGGSIRIGANVHLGPYTVIYGHGGVEIGDDCLVAMHCRILSSEHDLPPVGMEIRSRPDVLKPTRLGRDVWIGAGVTVLGGVTLGDGCVVGAGAVVTRDIPPGAISVGVPARVVGRRPSRSVA